MQLAGLVRRLLVLSSLIVFCSCSTTEDVVLDDGETYLEQKKSWFFVPYKFERTRITITEEEYNQRLERQKKEHAAMLAEKQAEHDAKMARLSEEQEAKKQWWCTRIVIGCIIIAVGCLFAGYITRQVAWFAGLSGLSLGVAAGVSIYAEFLHWLHGASGYIILALIGGGTLYLFRKFSLVDWFKVNLLNEEPIKTSTKE